MDTFDSLFSTFYLTIVRTAQSGGKLFAAYNAQQHARLRQMIMEKFDGISEIDCDAVYEDIVECMEYESCVKYSVFIKFFI